MAKAQGIDILHLVFSGKAVTHSSNMLASIIGAAAEWAAIVKMIATQVPWPDPHE